MTVTAHDPAVPVIVQKYGGTSVGTSDRICAIAERVTRCLEDSPRLVVVLSAMGKTTDQLVGLAHKVSAHPQGREMDLLLSTGRAGLGVPAGSRAAGSRSSGGVLDRIAVRDSDGQRLQHRADRVDRYSEDRTRVGRRPGRDS